ISTGPCFGQCLSLWLIDVYSSFYYQTSKYQWSLGGPKWVMVVLKNLLAECELLDQSGMTSSLSQDSHTTDPPVSEGATSSLSQDSYKTDSPVSEDSSPYTSLATTDHQDNINNGSRKGENTEQQTQTFTLLLTLSLLTNVILLIGVWHQHRSRHRPYRQDPPQSRYYVGGGSFSALQ
ncbi:hypothetical protein NFI96_016498, partial [Prochilodus magdalenae]